MPPINISLLQRGGLLLVAFFAAVIWATAFSGTLHCIGRPFLGFNYTATLFVTTLGTAGAENISQFDRIVAMNDRQVSSISDVAAILRTLPPGATIDVVVRHAGETRKSRTRLREYSWGDWLEGGPILIVGLLHLLVGFMVFWLRPTIPAARALLLFTVGFAAGLATAADCTMGRILPPGIFVGSNLAWALSFIHLALVFPSPHRVVQHHRQWVLWLYSPALVGGVLATFDGNNFLLMVGLTQAANLLTAIGALFLLGALVARARSSNLAEREQAALALLGATVAYLPIVLVWIVPMAIGFEPPANLATAAMGLWMLFPLALAYGIVRHRLFDIEVVIKRTAAYTALVILLGSGYLIMTASLRLIANKFFGGVGDWPGVFATAIIALAFVPIRDRTIAFVDHFFGRDKYDFARITSHFATITRSTVELATLLTAYRDSLMQALGTNYVLVLLETAGTLKAATALPEELAEETLTISLEEARQLRQAGISLTRPAMLPPDALCAPLTVGDDLLGLVVLGPRASELPYSETDRLLIANLTQQLAGAVQIASLVEQIAAQERLKRDIEIARNMQIGLLPQELPQIANFELLAWTLPAWEIGGDFYDIIHLAGSRWGIIVGDVVGKGIPAALLAAGTLAAFRAIAPRQSSPAEVLQNLNDFLHKYRPSNKLFVAAQYWILDAGNGSVILANAGQPLPLFNGQPIDLKGFPLGVDPLVCYRELQLQLAPGDALVGYSDGLEDIRSPSGESYGFMRVLPAAAACREGGLREMGEQLRTSLEGFAAGRSRFDDVTVVGIRRILSLAESNDGPRTIQVRAPRTTFLPPFTTKISKQPDQTL
ncbi:MAG: SpoIIE family protein phosphatase [Cyanobacteria bacterium NC_groundwater_1444_Ag_S-0.65um_54_12]|nr:SpoIIE family protein phosphatase [Cyanobacteria bacterium NC_groundwater_1444_Ag_S-0.65um_54_12]